MPGSNAEFAQKTQTYWNNRNTTHDPSRWLFWYQHPQALAHYRRLVSPIQAPVWHKPLHCYLTEHYPQRRFERGLSIGCGAAYKELLLLDDDVVGVFDLFELSDAVIAAGCRAAAEAGLAARARFHHEDIFGLPEAPEGVYDLVHWDNSLHHMFSVDQAIAFSARALKPGGVLVIDDYVGPSYMQVSERVYAVADKTRSALPEKYLVNNTRAQERFPLIPKSPRIPVQHFLDSDPSEMADSGNILAAARRHLPGVTIIPTGGILFFLGLRPLFGNFDETDPTDHTLLEELLAWDHYWTLRNPDDTFHAFLCWKKPG